MSKVTLDVLLDRIWFGSGSSTEKGSRFERLIAAYLRTAAEYRDRFSEVYLWQDWPGRQGQSDHGIDIVAKDEETGGWCAVQCKFYDPQAPLQKDDIDSFLSASGKQGFTSRIIVSTTDHYGAKAEATLEGQQVPVSRVGLSQLFESNVDWDLVDFEKPLTELPTTERKKIRRHQQQALDAVAKGFTTHDRGKLIMACGTGKTFTSLKIAENLATGRKAQPTTVLFLVPSIQLLNQSLREWKQESDIPFRAYAVCSDTKVGKKAGYAEDIATTDLVIPATTDTDALVAQVARRGEHDQFTVIFSTYQSIDVVARAQQRGMREFDLIICDEAHRTTGVTIAGEDDSQFVRVHDQNYLKGSKRLYMTATPRLFDDSVKQKAKDADAVLASMDDEAVYGPEFHRLGFGEAVEADLLTDYKVLVLAVDEAYVAENFQQQMAAQGELQLGDAAKIIGCWNGLSRHFVEDGDESSPTQALPPMRRAVAFAKDIKASKQITSAFPDIVDRQITAAGVGEDPLRVAAKHVDGTQNALERGTALEWLKAGDPDDNICRILSNARCLSEGVDVPALDAVMFLTPRSSQVDVVQSVGRVMRKAEGKDLGYIILPIVVPSGIPADEALRDNNKYKVVWQVLQALRAHDDRFNAMINQIELNKKRPEGISVIGVPGGNGRGTVEEIEQLKLSFDIGEWTNAIYAKIVAKCGERRYWETWAKDIAQIAQTHITRISGLLQDPESVASREFDGFLQGLRGNLNDGITKADAVEMLAQHLITKPVFDALFGGYDFAKHNPVAQTMERMLEVLQEHSLDDENASLEKFYASVRTRVQGIDNAEGRQRIIVELYDKFFATAFKKTVDKLGIVYTPVEIVDFILNSADQVLREHFGQGLTDEGVHILDGFTGTGTGTFMTRLLQSGLIQPEDLARKYANELHANEILLLAYYIAAVNIETTYQDLVRGGLDEQAEYEPFPGLILTDTFQSWEDDDTPDFAVFPENNKRLERLKGLDITVIVGNPPYSSGQDSANDNNQNEKYPHLDAAIRDTYAARSTATNKNSLYDSYIRAIKWATLRIKDRGVIAFVTNGGFLDSNTADGMRKTLVEELSAVHVFNLRGNQRTVGEQSRKEGGKVFDAGSRATVAITILVKDPTKAGRATVHYTDIGDYLSREEKLRKIAGLGGLAGLAPVIQVTPNAHGDWLNQRSGNFERFVPIGGKGGKGGIFAMFSGGLKTNRDAWVYNFNGSRVQANVSTMIENYMCEVESRRIDPRHSPTTDATLISWNRGLLADYHRGKPHSFHKEALRFSAYRPFTREVVYFHRSMNDMVYRIQEQYPSQTHQNLGFWVSGVGCPAPFMTLMLSDLPALHLAGAGNPGQFFSRWRYELVAGVDMLDLEGGQAVHEGYRRVDNITDEALRRFWSVYDDGVTKDDIFFYVYGLLHSPEYRETYAADLKKMLPRIPLVEDAHPFIDAGRALSELHLGYESMTPYPLEGLAVEAPPSLGLGGDSAAYDFFRVEKMGFGKASAEQKKAGLKHDRTTIIYNNRITLSGIPEEAYRYMLGSRSAIEWIMDRYQVKTDKASGIVNDPNDWSREVGDPRYILDLLARIVTVSLETMKIVDSLPSLEIRADQGAKS